MIVQARMGSRRLPGKVLADLCGAPILRWLVERAGKSERVDRVVVATTDEPGDDAVAELCGRLETECFRGHPTDVLERMVGAARFAGAGTVLRVSADSPLIDAAPVEAVAAAFAEDVAEIAENHRRPGWPVGTAVEALSIETLERLAAEAREPRHREHVTLYAYEEDAGMRVEHVPPPPELQAPALRLCVDTAEDLDRVRRICESLGPGRDFPLADVVRAARAEPELVA